MLCAEAGLSEAASLAEPYRGIHSVMEQVRKATHTHTHTDTPRPSTGHGTGAYHARMPTMHTHIRTYTHIHTHGYPVPVPRPSTGHDTGAHNAQDCARMPATRVCLCVCVRAQLHHRELSGPLTWTQGAILSEETQLRTLQDTYSTKAATDTQQVRACVYLCECVCPGARGCCQGRAVELIGGMETSI